MRRTASCRLRKAQPWATAYFHIISLLKILPLDWEAMLHVVYGLMAETGISMAPTWSVVRS